MFVGLEDFGSASLTTNCSAVNERINLEGIGRAVGQSRIPPLAPVAASRQVQSHPRLALGGRDHVSDLGEERQQDGGDDHIDDETARGGVRQSPKPSEARTAPPPRPDLGNVFTH